MWIVLLTGGGLALAGSALQAIVQGVFGSRTKKADHLHELNLVALSHRREVYSAFVGALHDLIWVKTTSLDRAELLAAVSRANRAAEDVHLSADDTDVAAAASETMQSAAKFAGGKADIDKVLDGLWDFRQFARADVGLTPLPERTEPDAVHDARRRETAPQRPHTEEERK